MCNDNKSNDSNWLVPLVYILTAPIWVPIVFTGLVFCIYILYIFWTLTMIFLFGG